MPFSHSKLRFECSQCGLCCCGGDDYYVAINQADMKRLCDYLDISLKWLKQRYVAHLGHALYTIRMNQKGCCVFLQSDNSCNIYPVRPVQCRTYPFWPELLDSRKSWNLESRRCEGINRGNIVPLKTVKSALKKQSRFEEDNE